jgi:hypothetical protein
MSSTRFDPPVPTIEQLNADGSTRPDEDGYISQGENDFASSTNKKTLRSYISSLSRGVVPTRSVVEYNGPVPDHANAYSIGDDLGNIDETFSGTDGFFETTSYSNSGLFDGRDDVNLGKIINKGASGKANGRETLSGHLLLQGVSTATDSATSAGAAAYSAALPVALAEENYNSPENKFDILAGRVKATFGTNTLSSATNINESRVSLDSMKEVAIRTLLAASGKKVEASAKIPTDFAAGFDPGSLVQIGSSRVDQADTRAAATPAGQKFHDDLDRNELPDSDSLNADDLPEAPAYTNKSYGTVYNPLEPFQSFTSSLTSFALLAGSAFGAALAVGGLLAAFTKSSTRIPTYTRLPSTTAGDAAKSGGAYDTSHLVLGRFKVVPDKVNEFIAAAAAAVGVSPNVAEILNIYEPTNAFTDYGVCVIAGFASLIGVSYEDDDIFEESLISGSKALSVVGVLKLAGFIAARLLVIPLTSERGYYMGIFREIVKESGVLIRNIGSDPTSLLSPTGIESITSSKVVRFIDTLARIGDLVILQAGARDFYNFNRENKATPTDPYLNGFNPNTDATPSAMKALKAFASQRIRGSRFGTTRGSHLGVSELPSAHLIPVGYRDLLGSQKKLTSFETSGSTGRTNLRLKQEEVAKLEDVLDAEYMPFYFQDLRTNEIIAFHAFLDDVSDSYTANYNSTSGYGRIENIHQYKDTKRSVGCTFHIIATNPEDFDYMWWQINKLTTMVYPQWSQGRSLNATLNGTDFKFTQPFSQIPTATPVIRLRIGDLIRSNYSRFNLKRLFGYKDTDKKQDDAKVSILYYVEPGNYQIAGSNAQNHTVSDKIDLPILYVPGIYDEYGYITIPADGERPSIKVYKDQIKTGTTIPAGENVASFYNPENNSIIRSFESTMGQGLAAVVTSLNFSWMDGLWGAGDDGPGNRAPRSCKVQMNFEPIHDIAPGLDHEGFNRAPIYPVGNLINGIIEGGETVNPYGIGTSKKSNITTNK